MAEFNGLLGDQLIQEFDSEKWKKAEKRAAEIIACIQPNQLSEERRMAVANYLQSVIMKYFPDCQVFTVGSVPLKTYLPDEHIDLTVFSSNPNLNETVANDVHGMLQTEKYNENAEFCIKEVEYNQEDVKMIDCLVENVVVRISFNRLDGLCTLCFLEQVDCLIGQNHLFKRSLILIKAWCYYESRLLGAHYGLISTYALEILVIYIFNIYNDRIPGPLQVLYHFLKYFSHFDWDNYCVSLWGPVQSSSLPELIAEPFIRGDGELLMSQSFLEHCSSVYAVFSSGEKYLAQQFARKYFNVIDPLCVNNNLGQSVTRGNFYRIRSAFELGAKCLARLLNCPKEVVDFEVNNFFSNTWLRFGGGLQCDAPLSENLKKDWSIQKDSKSSNINLLNESNSSFARTKSCPELTDTHNSAETCQSLDTLSNEYGCHLENLQYGRLCQSMVTPNYLQARVPWLGNGTYLPYPGLNQLPSVNLQESVPADVSNSVEPRLSEPVKSRLVINFEYEKQTDFDPELLEFGSKGSRNASGSFLYFPILSGGSDARLTVSDYIL